MIKNFLSAYFYELGLQLRATVSFLVGFDATLAVVLFSKELS